jgi:hypothetical protein
MPTQTPIDAAKFKPRPTLHFETLELALARAERAAAAERAGELQMLGNWSLGQICNHLATWIDYGFAGAPLRVPWLLRRLMPLLKRLVLSRPMRSGSTIPGVPGGTLVTERAETAPALEHLRRSIERLIAECPQKPNALFGPLSHAQWIQLTLRHCELHLSFAEIVQPNGLSEQ